MGLAKPTWTDPITGAVYTNVYLRIIGANLSLDAHGGIGDGTLTLAGYATKAARNAGKEPLFRKSVGLTRNLDSATPDTAGLAAVFGAPVGGQTALPRYNATIRAAYDFLKSPANVDLTGIDLSDAADDAGA